MVTRMHKIGDRFMIELPYSEVCMHLGLAGKVRMIEIQADGAQILDQEGRPYSIPITWGEAGVYTSRAGQPYTDGPSIAYRCPECGRVWTILDDANEWAYGHDCE